MKREFIAKNAKKVFAVALAAALAAPTALTVNVSNVAAATVPAPVATYDFSKGIEGIEGAEVTNSETIYVVKAASELSEGEKLDANGLVYTGEGKDAQYVTVENISSGPSVVDVTDSESLSSALQFDDTTAQIDEYQKKTSSKTDDMSEETAKYLDFQIPKNDYYYVESGTVSSTPVKTQNVSTELKIDNPFAGLADELKECEDTEDVTPQKIGTKYVPLWKKGVTIAYWIKVPVDEDGVYQNSSVLRWENDNEYYLQADDYSKYLPTKLWDQQYAKLTDKQKADGLKYSPSGVLQYGQAADGTYNDPDGLLDFYFDYAGGYYTQTDTGFEPTLVTDSKTGNSGPVYDYALVQTMQAALKGKTRFTGSARFFFANPNYKDGFYMAADGTLTAMFETATYDAYSKLPEITDGEGNVTYPETSHVKLTDAHQTITSGQSNIRYALEDGELQIDADNSVFWVPDNVLGINENSNIKASYGTKAGMQNANVFFMNSWTESRGKDANGNGSYSSATYVANSPVSKDNKKNANAGTWHHVAITVQNDWVEFYVDGELVDVESNYSSRGAVSLDTSKSFKRFNKGAGMRNGAGSEKDMGNISYGNYVCRLLMDWISDENSKLCLGGIGNYANEYAQATTTSQVCIGDIQFYKNVLTEEQILDVYEGNVVNVVKGDVDGDGKVSLTDVTSVLKFALNIVTPADDSETEAADYDGDGKISLSDVTSVLKVALGIIK